MGELMKECLINDHGCKVNCNDNNGGTMPCHGIVETMPCGGGSGSELDNLTFAGGSGIIKSDVPNLTFAEGNEIIKSDVPNLTFGKGNEIIKSDVPNLTCVEGNEITMSDVSNLTFAEGNEIVKSDVPNLISVEGNEITMSDVPNLSFGGGNEISQIIESDVPKLTFGVGNEIVESDVSNLTFGEGNEITMLDVPNLTFGEGNEIKMSDVPNLTFFEGNEIVNGCSLANNVDDDDNNGVKFGDNEGKLRCLFDQVFKVLLRGKEIPTLFGYGQVVDFLKLFCLVRARGGFRGVSEDKLWGMIAEKLGFECSFCGCLKLIYYKYLDDLDKWLSRITNERYLENGSGFGGSLVSLSIELKKMLEDFSIDGKGIANGDGSSGGDKLSEHIDVPMEETVRLPNAKKGNKVRNVGVKVAVDKGKGLRDRKKLDGKAKVGPSIDDSTFRKRKRSMVGGMLNWLIKVAKNPCHPSVGTIPGCSKWKETNYKDFWSVALMVRKARMQKRCIEPSAEKSQKNKKHRMHPSMYKDFCKHHSVEGLRCSRRLPSSEHIPCQCCKSSSADKSDVNSALSSLPENVFGKLEDVKADFSDTKLGVIPSYDLPVENRVLVGSKFQAEVPIWTGLIIESDPKWLGTQIWTPDLEEENPCREVKLLSNERPESCSCNCPLQGSVNCYRLHIEENRMKLKRELGLKTFLHWKFDSMGEVVSLSWSPGEEEKFKEIVKKNMPSLGKSIFPRRTWKELVSYYFNVYLINRRSYQNRVTPKNIDSDDDEVEFGSVGASFGYNAVKAGGSDPPLCFLNEQDMDFD